MHPPRRSQHSMARWHWSRLSVVPEAVEFQIDVDSPNFSTRTRSLDNGNPFQPTSWSFRQEDVWKPTFLISSNLLSMFTTAEYAETIEDAGFLERLQPVAACATGGLRSSIVVTSSWPVEHWNHLSSLWFSESLYMSLYSRPKQWLKCFSRKVRAWIIPNPRIQVLSIWAYLAGLSDAHWFSLFFSSASEIATMLGSWVELCWLRWKKDFPIQVQSCAGPSFLLVRIKWPQSLQRKVKIIRSMNLLQSVYLSNGRTSVPRLVVAAKAPHFDVWLPNQVHLSILTWCSERPTLDTWAFSTGRSFFRPLLLGLLDLFASAYDQWPSTTSNYIQCSVIFSKTQWSSAIFSDM